MFDCLNHMFYSPKLYLKDWWISTPILGAFFLQVFMWWSLISNIHPDSGQIFLHYNIIFGVDLVGEWWKFFLLPLSGMLIFLINYLFSFIFYASDKFLARLMSFWVLFIHVFLTVSVVLLVRMNS